MQENGKTKTTLCINMLQLLNSGRVFKVSELARACNMSESGLFAFFRDYAHTTPISLKQKVLSERAVEALCCTDRSVEEIARDLGFCSSAHLRKTLKSVMGKTPSGIRRSAGTI